MTNDGPRGIDKTFFTMVSFFTIKNDGIIVKCGGVIRYFLHQFRFMFAQNRMRSI